MDTNTAYSTLLFPDNQGEHVGSHLSRLPSSFHCLLRNMFDKPLSILSEEINLQGL